MPCPTLSYLVDSDEANADAYWAIMDRIAGNDDDYTDGAIDYVDYQTRRISLLRELRMAAIDL